MIVSGNSIKGLFLYNSSAIYEVGDLVYYLGNLYVLNRPNDELYPDDPNSGWDLYLQLNNSKVLTKESAIGLINQLIEGAQVGGNIAYIDYSLIDSKRNTGLFRTTNPDGDECILRVYSFDNIIYQELIAPNIPMIAYRNYQNGAWSTFKEVRVYNKNNATDYKDCLSHFETLWKKSYEIASTNNSNLNKLQLFTYVGVKSDNLTFTVPKYSDEFMIRCIFTYYQNGSSYQSEFSADLSAPLGEAGTDTVSTNAVSNDGTIIRISRSIVGNNLVFKVTAPSNLTNFEVLKFLLYSRTA